MDLLISLLVTIALAEAYAWLPRLSALLIHRAVARLPADLRPRYAEEWESYLEAFPNSLVRLGQAISLNLASRQVAREAFGAKLEDIGRNFGRLDHACAEGLRGVESMQRTLTRTTDVGGLAEHIDAAIGRVGALAPAPTVSPELRTRLVDSFSDLCRGLLQAATTLVTLTERALLRHKDKLERIAQLTVAAQRTHAQACSLLHERPWDVTALDHAIEQLESQLAAIRAMIDEPCDEDAGRDERKRTRLLTALQDVLADVQGITRDHAGAKHKPSVLASAGADRIS